MQVRIYYEDTDAGGVVYNANYIKYCERARSEVFFQKGIPLQKDNEFFVVKHIDASFIKPAFLGDLLDVTIQIKEKKAASVVMYQEILRDGEVLFTALVTAVYVKDFRPCRIPKEILGVFE